MHHLDTPPGPVKNWFERLLALYIPHVDHLDQLPAETAPVFGFDAEAARANPENAAVLATDSARTVLTEFALRVRTRPDPITPEIFKSWINEIKTATGVKGKDLFHPVRIALTGSHSGPEFDRLLPLIENGSMLGIGIPCVRDRVESFVGV
jgi:nondiscriminating glutamyl-tRNA synthetase